MATKAKSKSKTKPKSKAKAKGKAAKVQKLKAGIGHNSGQINEPLKKLFKDYLKGDDDKKAIGKWQRDLKAKAKEEHGCDKEVFSHEVKLMKMDSARRKDFEQGHAKLKDSLGYQHVLDLLEEDPEAEAGEDQTGNGEEEGSEPGEGEPGEEAA